MFQLIELITSNPSVLLFEKMCQFKEQTLVILNTLETELSHICFLSLACCIFEIVFQLSEPTSTIKFTNAVILSSSFNFNRSSCNLKAMFWLVELIPSNSAVFLFQTMCQPREKRLVILNTIDVELSHICFLYSACCIFETVFQQTDLPSTIKFTNAVIISIIVVFFGLKKNIQSLTGGVFVLGG